jgi:hypothetical protein
LAGGWAFSRYWVPDERTMLKSIPVDVWIAMMIAVGLVAARCEVSPTFLLAIYAALCGYVILETFSDELN